jgi:hypothetical protein
MFLAETDPEKDVPSQNKILRSSVDMGSVRSKNLEPVGCSKPNKILKGCS